MIALKFFFYRDGKSRQDDRQTKSYYEMADGWKVMADRLCELIDPKVEGGQIVKICLIVTQVVHGTCYL